ncbi:hypothetical protein D9C73_008826 [Collichthys lucidus]|uniref:Uncharacterized protein n=1 Tax=Collichthys lucidus TaxID=240159 RepID=A0A4U5UJ27_COLLU|nr:hypothetical protein D9C73_008826 [Collichthys lucidus]
MTIVRAPALLRLNLTGGIAWEKRRDFGPLLLSFMERRLLRLMSALISINFSLFPIKPAKQRGHQSVLTWRGMSQHLSLTEHLEEEEKKKKQLQRLGVVMHDDITATNTNLTEMDELKRREETVWIQRVTETFHLGVVTAERAGTGTDEEVCGGGGRRVCVGGVKLTERMDGCSLHGRLEARDIAPRNASWFFGRMPESVECRQTLGHIETLCRPVSEPAGHRVSRDTHTNTHHHLLLLRITDRVMAKLHRSKVTAAIAGYRKKGPRMPLSSCTFQPPAENKVDGVMEGALEKGGEGDEAPSAEIEQLRASTHGSALFFTLYRTRVTICAFVTTARTGSAGRRMCDFTHSSVASTAEHSHVYGKTWKRGKQ